jgi:hypothetical protein
MIETTTSVLALVSLAIFAAHALDAYRTGQAHAHDAFERQPVAAKAADTGASRPARTAGT